MRTGSFYDDQTGKKLQYSNLIAIIPKRQSAFPGGYITVDQINGFERLAMQGKALGREGYTVLMALLASLDFQNLIQISQAELGRKIGMRPQNVQRALKTIMRLNIITEGPRIGTHRTYRLNPEIAWKGSAKEHNKAIATRNKAAKLRLAAQNGETVR